MMCPGGDPAIQERWDAMWKWLQAQHRTRADQIKRLQALKQLLREDQEEASSEKRTQAIQDLRDACASPFVADEYAQLYACRTDIGLIFIHDRPKRFALARRNGIKMPLFLLDVDVFGDYDEVWEVNVLTSAPIPRDQILPWGEAAAIQKWLFAIAPPIFGSSPDGVDDAG